MNTEKSESTYEYEETGEKPGKKSKKGNIVFFFVVGVIFLITLAVNIIYTNSVAFADFFNERISSGVRAAFATVTACFPFSLAEFLALTSILWVILLIRHIHIIHKDDPKSEFIGIFKALIVVLLTGYTVFVWMFGAGYKTSTLDRKMNIEKKPVSEEELYETAMLMVDRLNALNSSVTYMPDGSSVRPFSHDECVRLCHASYGKLMKEYDFIGKVAAPVKQLVVSDIMTYTHISGFYSFLTGEANLNTNYPYYINVYTTAHEMAHQRGIAREDEANFIAYLVCIHSDDPYMQYSGYLNMYEYLSSALYEASPALYGKVYSALSEDAKGELRAYAEFFEKYRTNPASDISDTVNDAYLKSQGTPGEISYGMVVDLAVAYHKER